MELSDILEDQTHGSTYLAKNSLRLIIEKQLNTKETKQMISRISDHFRDMQIMESLNVLIQQSNNPLKTAKNLLEQLENSTNIISKKIQSKLNLGSRIITYSHSQTLQEVLNGDYFVIYCMISQPEGEGKEMVSNLKNAKLISDEQGRKKLSKKNVDALFLGCDQFSNENFVNKKGSKKLVEICNQSDLPVYVLTSELKYRKKIGNVETEMFEKCPIFDNVFIITDS